MVFPLNLWGERKAFIVLSSLKQYNWLILLYLFFAVEACLLVTIWALHGWVSLPSNVDKTVTTLKKYINLNNTEFKIYNENYLFYLIINLLFHCWKCIITYIYQSGFFKVGFQCKGHWNCKIYMYLHGHTIWNWDLSVNASLSAWSHKFLECLDQPLYSTENKTLNIFHFWQIKAAKRGYVLNLSCPVKPS